MKPSRPSIQIPSEEDLKEAARNLHLDAYGTQRLAQVVRALAARIRRKIADGSYDAVKLRAQKKELSKTLKKQFADLGRTLRDPRVQIFNVPLTSDLAALLSSAAFERATGENIGDEISSRDLTFAQRSRAPYRELEAEAELKRRVHAELRGAEVLGKTLDVLARRLERVGVADPKRNSGGADPEPVRREILLTLVSLHNEFNHRYGGRWGRKRYFDLAETMLALLGQPTDGLEQATKRLLDSTGGKWIGP